MNATLTKIELAAGVAAKTGLTQSKAVEVVDATMEEIQNALVTGKTVVLRNFGALRVKQRAERTCRNPFNQSATPIVVPPKKVVKFKIGHELDKALNTP